MATPSAATAHTLTIAGASIALATLVPVALYQTGVIKSLPDPPGEWFASERITKSKDAYPLGIPDALPGLASYSATLALALLAPGDPLARRLLGPKLALDGAVAGFNFAKQIVKYRKLCSWCSGTSLATAVTCVAGRSYLRKAAF